MTTRACLALLLAALCASQVHAEVGDTWREVDLPFAVGANDYILGSFKNQLWATGHSEWVCDCPSYEPECTDCHTEYYADLWRSSNGTDWTLLLEHAPFGYRRSRSATIPRLLEFKGQLYMIGGSSADYWRSMDGVFWNPVFSQIPTADLNPPVIFGDRIILLGSDVYTEDGLNWNFSPDFVTPPFDMSTIRRIAAAEHNGYLYAFQSQHMWRSSDGYQWTEITGGNASDLMAGSNVFLGQHMLSFAGKLWLGGSLIVPFGSTSNLFATVDGIEWRKVCTGSTLCPWSTPNLFSIQNKIYVTSAGAELLFSELKCEEVLGESSHSADYLSCGSIDLSELLRVVQFYNFGGLHCDASSEDGYGAGVAEDLEGEGTVEGAVEGEPVFCLPHSSDYAPQDWRISLNELLRLVQLYNAGAYHPCGVAEEASEDGFCLD